MNIVILDGHTLNPGDLSWQNLQDLGELTVYQRTQTSDIVERSLEADIVLTNKVPLRADIIALLPKLKYIGVLATGYDVVDVKAAAEQGIVVANIPGYGTESVAQMVFALLLELCHNVGAHNEAVQSGEWVNSMDWCFWKSPLIELKDKTLGIVGYGRIGQQVGQIAQAFGMKIVALQSGTKSSDPKEDNIQRLEWEELLAVSDVLTLHCPLTPQTEGCINKKSLSQMKATSLIINTSRGKLIIEQDLADALNQGIIAGAALDVLSTEPPQADNPLLKAQHCLITPHIAWATKEARSRMLNIACDNIKAFQIGDPQNIVR